MQQISAVPRLCACGAKIVAAAGVGFRKTAAGIVGLSGLETCGSVWACPVCNAKIMARRAFELGAAVTAWEAKGGAVALVTFTMRHNVGQDLADLWSALAYAWSKVTSGKAWTTDKAWHGVAGWVRVVEVTVSWDNGWHVHIHALVMLDEGTQQDTLDALHTSMFGRWSRALQRKGLDAPLMVGQDARIVDGASDERLAMYLTKAQDVPKIGMELTHSQSKTARTEYGSMTPWELLTLVDESEEEHESLAARDLWAEWEVVSRGKRQIGWSKGLRDLLGLGAEKDDDEVAAEVVGEDSDTVLYVTPQGWAQMRRTPVLIGTALDTLDAFGAAALRTLLLEHGIDFQEV